MVWLAMPLIMFLYTIMRTVFTDNYNYVYMHSEYELRVKYQFVLFIIVGCATLMYVLILMLVKRKRVFNKEAFKENPFIFLLIASLVWTIICSFTSDSFIKAFTGRRHLFNGLSSIILFAAACACTTSIRTEYHRKRITQMFCGMLSFLSIFVLIQAYADTILDRMFTPDFSSVFNHHNHFGYLLCMGVVGFMMLYLFDGEKKRNKVIYLLGEALLLITLFVNDTFGCYLAIIMTIPFIYLFLYKKDGKIKLDALLPLVVFVLLSVINSFGLIPETLPVSEKLVKFFGDVYRLIMGIKGNGKTGHGRGYLWKESIKKIAERPIFGFGPSGLYGKNAIILAGIEDSPHNEFLERGTMTGIPGMILYFATLITLWIHHWKKSKELDYMEIACSCVMLVYLFSSCFGNPVFNTAPYFYMFLGLSTATNESVYPLIHLENEEADKLKQTLFTKRKTMLYCSILLIFSLSYLGYKIYSAIKYEPDYEFMDLANMQVADITVRREINSGHVKPGETYFYNATSYKLMPIGDKMPVEYGKGTKRLGGATKKFEQMHGTTYGYDESKSYVGKVIQVKIIKTGENPEYELNWVNAYEETYGGA